MRRVPVGLRWKKSHYLSELEDAEEKPGARETKLSLCRSISWGPRPQESRWPSLHVVGLAFRNNTQVPDSAYLSYSGKTVFPPTVPLCGICCQGRSGGRALQNLWAPGCRQAGCVTLEKLPTFLSLKFAHLKKGRWYFPCKAVMRM